MSQKTRIRLSIHALGRMNERKITRRNVENFIKFPDKIEVSKTNKNRFLVKKIYYNQTRHKDYLAMIICEQESDAVKIITVIDTSKISKYI